MSASAIEQLCSYFEREVDAIARLGNNAEGALDGEGNVRRYRKALLISTIDTLAGLRFNQSSFPQLARSNRERFIRFLAEHASWEECGLVSLPFLVDALTKKGLGRSALATHAAAKVSLHNTDMANILRAARMDEPMETLAKLATSEVEENALAQCAHSSILYRYRNFVVHESRTPGYAMEVSEEPTAHYSGYINSPYWHLAYPLQMFVRISKNCIASFREYLTANNLDPYDAVSDTTRW